VAPDSGPRSLECSLWLYKQRTADVHCSDSHKRVIDPQPEHSLQGVKLKIVSTAPGEGFVIPSSRVLTAVLPGGAQQLLG